MRNNKLNKRTIIFLLLLFISFLMQSLGSVILNDFFPKEKKIYDPRFQQLAYNLYTHHTFAIRWGTSLNPNQIMINPYEIQKGVYYNWFPVGYAFIIYITMLISINYFPILYLLQLILYSFIPPLIFLLSYDFLIKKTKNYFIAILSALLFLLNPYYLISAIWITDTWMTTLISILCFYLLLVLKANNSLKIKLIFGLSVLLLFFFRPISLLPMLICFIIYTIGLKKIFSFSAYYISAVIIILGITIWGYRNYLLFDRFDLTHSNVGYNLWLGNNEYSSDFLKKHFGDGASIEDKLIPYFDKRWAFLKNYSEYQKDAFFEQQAWNFIKSHPMETLENASWKIVGFWSPLRVRTGHWSESRTKTIFILIYNTPLIILSFFSVLSYFWRKEYKINKEKGVLILFMFLWMLPHLAFFSTSRFRTPIDFGLIILTIDFLSPFLSRFFDKLRTTKY